METVLKLNTIASEQQCFHPKRDCCSWRFFLKYLIMIYVTLIILALILTQLIFCAVGILRLCKFFKAIKDKEFLKAIIDKAEQMKNYQSWVIMAELPPLTRTQYKFAEWLLHPEQIEHLSQIGNLEIIFLSIYKWTKYRCIIKNKINPTL